MWVCITCQSVTCIYHTPTIRYPTNARKSVPIRDPARSVVARAGPVSSRVCARPAPPRAGRGPVAVHPAPAPG